MNKEWIAGKNPVLEALRAKQPIHKIWLAKQVNRTRMNEVIYLARQRKIALQEVPRQKLDRLTAGFSHQGVVAFVPAYAYASLEELFNRAANRKEDPFFIILDHLEDPHNFGSILRTADAAGVHGVIIPKRRSAGVTQTVVKTSAGAVQYVPVARVSNLAQTMDDLKTRGIWIFGTDIGAPDDYRQADFNLPLTIVIGNEGKGMSRIVREKCDFLLRLPSVGQVSSLNASVAAALIMYEVYRQRHPVA